MRTKKICMQPGPTPVVRSIQEQMGRETDSFGDASFVNDYKGLIEDLKLLWKNDGEVFVVGGTGTLAMEMAIANTTKKGDNILIVSHGYFGDRFIEICGRKGLNVDVISSEWGEIVSLDEIEKKLGEKEYAVITTTHVDTSTGTCAPIREIGKIVEKFENTLFIVDGVCASSAEPEYMDEMGIDVLLTGSQKAFGVSPGIAIVWANKKALERRDSFESIPEYYIDFKKWIPVMQNPAKYFATPPVNLIWAMKESVRLIKEEGIENRYERHRREARAIQSSLEAMGFKILANKNNRAVTLSNVIYPEGINDVEFRNTLAEEGIVVAGGLGAYAGKMFRLGHMGNIDTHVLVTTVAAIERTAIKCGINIEVGTGINVLQESLLSLDKECENI